jgi:hypothetical protein
MDTGKPLQTIVDGSELPPEQKAAGSNPAGGTIVTSIFAELSGPVRAGKPQCHDDVTTPPKLCPAALSASSREWV